LSASPAPLSTSDRAFLRAVAAWAPADPERIWSRLDPEWAGRMKAAEEASTEGPGAARELLRREHSAEARPDPGQVHPSWWVRALEGESPAVLRAVAAHGPPHIRDLVRREFFLEPDDLRADVPPLPEALEWALALWSERLVGGPVGREDDPPVVRALTLLRPPGLFRLAHVIGLAKLAYATKEGESQEGRVARPRDRARFEPFRAAWDAKDSRLVRIALWDLDDLGEDQRRFLSWLGLTTIGRLLTVVEPHRTRWALQHLPYPVAKQVRTKVTLKNPLASGRTLLAWEGRTFDMARERLREEGRLSTDLGGPA
jgi:hypothetical protein